MYMKYVCYPHKDIKSASDIERANKIGICKHFPQYFECMNGQEPRDTASCLRKGTQETRMDIIQFQIAN